jgi:hypothetical protein
MRRILIAVFCIAGLAAVAFARPRQTEIEVAVGASTGGSATEKTITGYIDEIVIEKPEGATSADITVKAAQPMGNEHTFADKTVSATTLIRPRMKATTADGTEIGTNVLRYMTLSDAWTVAVTNSNPTGVVWRVWIKYED